MKKEPSSWKSRYPLLHQFFRGYLHQDFPEEYGSIAGALRQYRVDAGDDEFGRFSAEWDKFLEETGELSAGDIDQILSIEMGGSWHIASRREVARFTAAIGASGTSRAS
jgi:hypothetical protein